MHPDRSRHITRRTVASVAAALALTGFHAGAQADTTNARAITLGGILQTTMRSNPSLQLAGIDIQIAEARVVQETGIDDWTVSAAASWTANFKDVPETDFTGTTAFNAVGLNVDLLKPLSAGGTLGLHSDAGFSKTTYKATGMDNTSYDATLSASYTQPLMQGRGKDIARADLAQARINKSAAEKAREADAIAVLQSVILAYWDLAYALNDVKIRNSSLALAKERLRLTKLRIQAGTLAKVEALAVEQVIATREEEVLVAELSISDRSLSLRRLAGLPIGPKEIDLTTDAPLSVKERPLDVDALIAQAYRFSPELAALELQKQGQRISVNTTKNGTIPRLDLSLNFGPTASSDRAGDAAKRLVTFDGVRMGVSLSFSQKLKQRGARGAHQAARAQLFKTKVSIADVKAQIALAIARAVKTAKAAQLRMKISERAIDLSKKNIDAEQGRYSLGRATNFDVAQRQEELKTAQLRYARAAFDYLKATAQIDALTGDLLPKYGITLAPKQ